MVQSLLTAVLTTLRLLLVGGRGPTAPAAQAGKRVRVLHHSIPMERALSRIAGRKSSLSPRSNCLIGTSINCKDGRRVYELPTLWQCKVPRLQPYAHTAGMPRGHHRVGPAPPRCLVPPDVGRSHLNPSPSGFWQLVCPVLLSASASQRQGPPERLFGNQGISSHLEISRRVMSSQEQSSSREDNLLR